jgi:hypothetical protein
MLSDAFISVPVYSILGASERDCIFFFATTPIETRLDARTPLRTRIEERATYEERLISKGEALACWALRARLAPSGEGRRYP